MDHSDHPPAHHVTTPPIYPRYDLNDRPTISVDDNFLCANHTHITSNVMDGNQSTVTNPDHPIVSPF